LRCLQAGPEGFGLEDLRRIGLAGFIFFMEECLDEHSDFFVDTMEWARWFRGRRMMRRHTGSFVISVETPKS